MVGLVLETLRDPVGLRAALHRAAELDVTVVALTVGASQAGRAMVAAHSGALAGADGAWEALFDAYGVVRVHDLDELGDTLELFAAGRRAGPAGPGSGIATVHDSGAERALVVDVADVVGVPFAAIGDTTRTALAGLLDPGLEADNPLDVWGTGADTEGLFTGCLTALADDDAVRAVAPGRGPGGGVRRRRVLPRRRFGRRRVHHQAGGRSGQPGQRHRPGGGRPPAGRWRAGPRGHAGRALGPAAPARAVVRTGAAADGHTGRLRTANAVGGAPGPGPARRGRGILPPGRLRHPGAQHGGRDRRGRGRRGGAVDRVPRRAQDGRARYRPQVRRRRGGAGTGRRPGGRRRVPRHGRSARAARRRVPAGG